MNWKNRYEVLKTGDIVRFLTEPTFCNHGCGKYKCPHRNETAIVRDPDYEVANGKTHVYLKFENSSCSGPTREELEKVL